MPEIAIDLVVRGRRVRGIDERHVTALMTSIDQIGLMNPITVAPFKLEHDGSVQNGWTLIGGLHRLEAMARLGHVTIAAIVMDLSGPAAVVAQCDENLLGPALSATERALFTKHRRAAYLELHPETAAHVAGAHAANRSMGNASAVLAPAFTADAAAKTGKPERTIQRDAQRGERIPEEILQRIVRTPLDKGAVLDRLSRAESPERELDIIKREGEAKRASPRKRSASNRAPQEQTPVLSTNVPQAAEQNGDRSSHVETPVAGLFSDDPLPALKDKQEINEAAESAKRADREQARENSRQFAQLLREKIDSSQWEQVIVWLGHCNPDAVIEFLRQEQFP